MKKNVIALAVAAGIVAAPMAAQADVKVGGQVKLTVKNSDDYTLKPAFDNNLSFSASEDLGNGMTAFTKMVLDMDDGTAGGDVGGTKDLVIGMKTGMGTIVGGYMESITEGQISSKMDNGSASHGKLKTALEEIEGGDLTAALAALEGGNLESSLTSLGRVHALAYVSPAFSGLTVGVAAILGVTDDAIEGTDIALMYKNGDISVDVSSMALADDDATGIDESDFDILTVGVGYTGIDNLKLGAQYVTEDETDSVDMIFRADYTMGNNIIMVGMKDTDEDGASGEDVTSLKLTHKMSKTTALYIGHNSYEDMDAVTYAGMIKKF